MSDTGSAALSQGARVVETASRMLLEIIKMLVEARSRQLRNKLTREQIRSYEEGRDLRETVGLVNTKKLLKLAQNQRTDIIPTEAKISRWQLEELRHLAKIYGFSFAAIGEKTNGNEISDCEKTLKDLKSKGKYLLDDIKALDERRNEYIKSVTAAGKTVNDEQLKKFYDDKKALRDKYNNLEYLTDKEKAAYNAAYEKLHGNIEENKVGLYDKQDQVSLLVLRSDLQKLLMCTEQLKRETMENNLTKHIDYLKAKEAREGLSAEEKEKLNALLRADQKLQTENALIHNGATKKEIFENMFNSLSESNKGVDFSYATNKLVEQDGSGEPFYIVNPEKPDNYIKVSREYDYDIGRTVHTYEVYKDGVAQAASDKFDTQGIYTDKLSKTLDANGELVNRFIDKNGNETPPFERGSVMYWTALRQEMAKKTEMNDKGVFVFRSEEFFNQYQMAYKDYREEAAQEIEKNSYDMVENLGLSSEEAAEIENSITSTAFYDTSSLIADCKEEISNQGFSYTSAALGKESFVRNRENDEKLTRETLVGRLLENPNDKQAAILACNMRKIQLYVELEKIQLDMYTKSGEALDDQTKNELKELSEQKDQVIDAIQRCDSGLSACLSEGETREAIEKELPSKTEITHGEHIEEFENPETVQQWKEQADIERAAQATVVGTENKLNLTREQKAESVHVQTVPDMSDR